MITQPKHPSEVERYLVDFTARLQPGETLTAAAASYAWEAQAGLAVTEPLQTTESAVIVFVGAGEPGQIGHLLLTAPTSAGRSLLEACYILIGEPGASSPDAPPTIAHLLRAYPEFYSASYEQLSHYLEIALQQVDASWSSQDYGRAVLLLAAHRMTLAGIGSTPHAQAVSDGSAEFKAMRVGSLSLERFDRGAAASYDSTPYGREFKRLLRANRGGVRALNATAGLGADGDRSQAPTYPWGAP